LTASPPAPRASAINDAIRATFLAASWTWVIGMFLPVLLVREYGVWAWVIFAIPNCLGAAAMGWTLRTPAQSRDMVAAHRVACSAFSLVTIAFHVFVIGWIIVPWMSWRGWLPGVFVFAFAFLTMRSSGVGLAAVLTYIYSLICAALFLGDAGVNVVKPDALPPGVVAMALVALVPVCVLGFALNPYLDLTFHAARQASATPRSSRVAFGVGFCVLFLAMIAFTLAYSGVLWRDVLFSAVEQRPPPSESAVWFVAGHMLFQAAFTSGIHAASAIDRGMKWSLGVVMAIAVAATAAWWANRVVYRGEMLAGELVYRLFMSFYGLVFPAYAWVCMLPSWRNPTGPTQRQLIVFGAAVLLASPFYAIAFLGQRMPWALAGVLIVFLARFVVPGRRRAVDSA
jgi:hypothetical protein